MDGSIIHADWLLHLKTTTQYDGILAQFDYKSTRDHCGFDTLGFRRGK